MNAKNNRFSLTTAPRKNLFLLGVLILWLALWGGGLMVVAGALLRGEIKEVGFFVVFILLAWLAGWSLAGGLALYGLLWTVCGTETLVATSERFTLTRRLCGYQRVRHYDAAKIRNLRVVETEGMTDFLFSLRPFGIGNGLLTFDCGTTVVTFVAGGDRASAPGVLAELRAILFPGEAESSV
jgi:hypothetical protein